MREVISDLGWVVWRGLTRKSSLWFGVGGVGGALTLPWPISTRPYDAKWNFIKLPKNNQEKPRKTTNQSSWHHLTFRTTTTWSTEFRQTHSSFVLVRFRTVWTNFSQLPFLSLSYSWLLVRAVAPRAFNYQRLLQTFTLNNCLSLPQEGGWQKVVVYPSNSHLETMTETLSCCCCFFFPTKPIQTLSLNVFPSRLNVTHCGCG